MYRKSSFCRWDKDFECIEVGGLDTAVITMRSTINGGSLMCTRPEWELFLKGVKAGEFDLQPERALPAEVWFD